MLNMPKFIGQAALILILALPAGRLPAQGEDSSPRPQTSAGKQIYYPFEATDMIDGYIAPMKTKFYVGEPVTIPIVLVNHSQFPIHLETGFHPRSQLKIMIRPENEAQFQYVGPYMKGFYAPYPILLYPFDEFRSEVVLWSDWEQPGHLALAKPGKYWLTISVLVRVNEQKGATFRELPLVGGKSLMIELEPTPKPLEPFIELLKQEQNIMYLQLHKVPAGWNDKKVKELLEMYQRSVFAPYLSYALANYYAALFDFKPTKEYSDQALVYYRLATLNKTPFQEDAYLDFLTFLDEKLHLSVPAALIARELAANLPKDRLGRDGNLEILVKYLMNTKELSPADYWSFLP